MLAWLNVLGEMGCKAAAVGDEVYLRGTAGAGWLRCLRRQLPMILVLVLVAYGAGRGSQEYPDV